MRALILSAFLSSIALATVPAAAQSGDPSTNDIIQSLKPRVKPPIIEKGIRLGAPNLPAAASGDSSPSVSLNVQFPTGSNQLTPQARETLDKLAQALSSQDLVEFRFRIEGHTDTVGSPSYNKVLSQRRAEAVVGYLESTHGIPPTRLAPIGLGMDGLLVPTPPQTSNPQNRRVKIVNLGT